MHALSIPLSIGTWGISDTIKYTRTPHRDRPGTKFSRGRGRDQVESAGAGINRDFEMLPRPGPGPGLAKICRGRGRDFFNLILKIFESFRKLVSMWASFKVNLEGSYTMFKYNYTKRCLHYYYEFALFHCQISSYSFYRHSLLLARASLGTQGSRVMRAVFPCQLCFPANLGYFVICLNWFGALVYSTPPIAALRDPLLLNVCSVPLKMWQDLRGCVLNRKT